MLFAPLRSWTSASEPAARQNTGRRWANTSPREIIRQRYFPNLLLTTQENQQVRLYDDLIKDKVVLINFMYTSCGRICPRTTQNLVSVQRLLGERAGHEVFMYSFTLDPTHDTPDVLKEYAQMHHVGPGWQFLTGKPDEMEVLRRWESGIELRDPVKAGVEPALGAADIDACRAHVSQVVLDEKIRRYVVDLASATRSAPEIALGASTRAEVLLMLAARAYAAFDGHEFVTPDDVKALLAPAFRHRLILRPEAEVAGQTPDSVLDAVAGRVVPPR